MKLIRRILLVVGIIILSCVFITSCSLSTKKDKDTCLINDVICGKLPKYL